MPKNKDSQAATPLDDGGLLDVKQLASHLRLNERTILKLVAEGSLPGVKIGNQWRFRKAMIDTWLDDQMLGVSPRLVEARPAATREMFELSACFAPAQVVPELEARTKTGVIEELAHHAAQLSLIRDEIWFLGALVQRENLMPTATAHGVAFLHGLRRNAQQVVRPFMVLGRSTRGVPFDAPDGKPTHLFIALGLKYEELDLPWLSKLSQLFASREAVLRVLGAKDAAAIYDVLVASERALGGKPDGVG